MNTIHQEDAAPERTASAEDISAEDRPTNRLAAVFSERSTVHIPANARGIALAILATVAFVFALQWGQHFIIPLVFSILISYTLTPVVAWLEHIKIPRIVGTTLVLITLLCGAAVGANALRSEFQSILVRLPDAVHQPSMSMACNRWRNCSASESHRY